MRILIALVATGCGSTPAARFPVNSLTAVPTADGWWTVTEPGWFRVELPGDVNEGRESKTVGRMHVTFKSVTGRSADRMVEVIYGEVERGWAVTGPIADLATESKARALGLGTKVSESQTERDGAVSFDAVVDTPPNTGINSSAFAIRLATHGFVSAHRFVLLIDTRAPAANDRAVSSFVAVPEK